MEASSYDISYDFATNWRVADIAFESSSAAADCNGLDDNAAAAIAPAAKSPLLLLRPSRAYDPCEITITFARKHEVRQVYVRSTARVYRIYCTTRSLRSNECSRTVWCDVATRDEEVLQAPGSKAAASANPKELIKDPEGRSVKDNGNRGTNEDDWVEMKASDASLLSNGKNLPKKPRGRTQDLYEASAEINDAEPCISITLQLLLLEDKGCVFVDEMYVLGDPVDPTDSEQEASGAGNLAGSSLKATFMPTLSQLSRARDVSREQDKRTLDKRHSKTRETWRNSNDSTSITNLMNQSQQEADLSATGDREVNLPAVVDASAKPTEFETLPQVSGAESNPASSCNQVEIILHQLVSRVSRIEDILTRFEVQLLKPINSIDARLQRLEQKFDEPAKKSNNFDGLVGTKTFDPDFRGSYTERNPDIESDELTEKSQNLHFASCFRIFAPEYPCGDVDTDSSYSNRSENYDVEDVHNSSNNIVDPRSASHSLAGTDVTAAEPGIDDDKEGNHFLGKECFEEKPKHLLLINEVLASGLAESLSSALTKDIKYNQAPVVTAPELLNEEGGENDHKPLMDTPSAKSRITSACSDSSENAIYIKDSEDSESTLIRCTSAENGPEVADEMVDGIVKKCDHDEARDNDTNTVARKVDAGLDGDTTAEMGSDHFTEVTETEAGNQETAKDPTADEPENLDVSTGSLADNDSVTMQKRILSSRFVTDAEGNEDVLTSVSGFQHASSSVDFEIPVLNVTFSSEQTSHEKSFFGALFGDSPESSAELFTTTERNNDANQHNLIPVDDAELRGPPTDTISSMDMNFRDTSYMHLNLEGKALVKGSMREHEWWNGRLRQGNHLRRLRWRLG